MKVQRKGAAKTPKSLLAAGSEVFAEKGYRDATIAEICKRAGANIAAVNYHFGDKETLYKEAWRHSFSESLKAYAPDGGVSADAEPEQRLRGYIVAFLRRIADENNKEFLIAQRELANPTGLLEEVRQRELRPLREQMEAVVRALLGSHAPGMDVRFFAISIVSQCFVPVLMRRMRRGRKDGRMDFGGIDDIESYAEHVVRFSLAGIRAIREESERRVKRIHREALNENQ